MLHSIVIFVETGLIDDGAGEMDVAYRDHLVPDPQLEEVDDDVGVKQKQAHLKRPMMPLFRDALDTT
jgi:hypothetical protein